MQTPIKILIADDHPVYRKGLVEVISGDRQFKVVAEASDGETALESVQKLKPRIALIDIDMPRMNGLSLAEKLHSLAPEVAVIVLTSYKEESLFNRALDLGVKGYVLKENAVADLLRSLAAVAHGETFFSPTISSFLVNRIRRTEMLRSKTPSLDQLTPMELRVLRLVAENLTSAEIGKKLFISPRTVDSHRNSLTMKLDLHGYRGLLLFALDHRDELKRLKLVPEDFG